MKIIPAGNSDSTYFNFRRIKRSFAAHINFQVYILLLLLYIMVISGCNREPKYHKKFRLKGNISISGAFALYPMTVLWAEEFMKLYSDVEIDVSAGGAGKGMADVLNGMVDLGMVSRSINPSETAKGAWSISVVKDAVVPTISKANPYLDVLTKNGITKKQLVSIFVEGTLTEWNLVFKTNKVEPIHVFTRSDACGAGEMWGKYLGKNQETLKGVGVFGDPGMADAVMNEPAGIGYNNIIYVYDLSTRKVYDGICVLPIDFNENGTIDRNEDFYENLDSLDKAIAEGRYPSPPARELYFVSKGKPGNRVVKEFLKWILTDGQRFVKGAGYVKLPEEKCLDELSKIRFTIRKVLHIEKKNNKQ
jgi:phosphate transport system substrate-binding protein